MPTTMVDTGLLKVLMKNKPLVRLLCLLNKSEQGYATRELLRIVRSWGAAHRLIKQAEVEGYITRREVKPEGKGNWRKYNLLTPKGIEVVKLAKELGI